MRGILVAVLAIAAIMIGSYAANQISTARTLRLFNWYSQPFLTDAETGERITEAKAGDTVIMHYFVERHPIECWGTYIDAIESDTAMWQFPTTRSQVIVDETTRKELYFVKELPPHLPEGVYSWRQIIYPVCRGVEMAPFIMETGVSLTITR